MRVALIGLPQSGKTTLFSAVTAADVDPYAPREPRAAVVHVPDRRLDYLTALYNPKKVVEATIEFVDVPGCSLDDAGGQQEWRRLLPAVRKADLLIVVVRAFEDARIPAYRERVDAGADFSVMWDELIFADLDTVSTRLERLEAALKKPTRTHEAEKREQALLTRCREALESSSPLSDVVKTDEERRLVSSFAFLTQKPLIGVRNVSDDHAGESDVWPAPHATATLSLSAAIEAEIVRLDPPDQAAFMEDLALKESARDRLIRTCYAAGGLISFLTVGADEVRAWTIPTGATAVEAAARIHTDLARGFIRAETVSNDDLVAHTDMKGARAAGRVRKEGKSYVVQDGDILNILANP